MKKILLFASAIAGLFLASCQREGLEPVGGNTVTITVEAPGAINTKAIADGTNVNEVHYAVYKTNSNEDYSIDDSGAIDGPLAQGVVEMNNKRASVNFDLLQDQNYTVIFWAQVKDAGHYNLGDLRTIEVAKEVAGNDETRAAFFARYDFSTFEHKDHVVTLRRPFAQLNLLTTQESLNPVQEGQTQGYTIDVKTSEVIVKGLSTSFNTLTGLAPAGDETFTFVMADTPEEQGQETLTVNDKAYHYVSMNYFFVPEDEKLVDIEYTVVTDKGNIGHEIVAVPVKENYRTNVIGNLLTKETTFEIIVDPNFDGETVIDGEDYITVTSIEGLQHAINNAPEGTTSIIFANDIVGNATILQKENVNLIINGNDNKFDGIFAVNGGGRASGAETLTFQSINFETAGSDFTVISAPSKVGNQYNYSHNVTIEDCTFTGNQTVGAASFTGTYDLVMKNCSADNMHSILQVQSCDNNVLVEGVTVNNCKNGLSFGNTAYPTLKNSTISAAEYGVRADGNASRGNLVIENTTISATQPVIVRKTTTDGYAVALDNVTLSTEEVYQVVFTSGADDAAYVAPTVTYSITGADNYAVFPRDNYGEKLSDGLYKNAKSFYVANAAGLVTLSSMTLAGGESVSLVADIDLTGVEFNGISAFNPESNNTFDGKGHTVSNWTYTGRSDDMGFIKNWVGTIKNLTIKNAILRTGGRSAVIAAKPYGNIENCHVEDCNFQANYWACGLIAGMHNSGNMTNCTAKNSSIKSTGGTGAITGVLNETGGTRVYTGCEVVGCTIDNGGDDPYGGAAIVGLINIDNTAIKFINCVQSNNTYKNTARDAFYGYNAGDNTTVTIE